MVQALGAKLLDAAGHDIQPGGGALAKLDRIDVSRLDPRIAEAQIDVACDVENPLVGATGAAVVFGPQKGATPDTVKALDANLTHYATIVARDMGKSVASLARGGAAGGLGAGLAAFLNAHLVAGIDLVIDATGIEDHLRGADLLITGEGMIDSQTIYGKVPVGIALRARKFGVPVVAIVGCIGPSADVVYDHGIDGLMSIVPCPMALDTAMRDAFALTADASARMLRLVKIGLALGKVPGS
jgi:glycerate kinase